jgi:hypothetical protein
MDGPVHTGGSPKTSNTYKEWPVSKMKKKELIEKTRAPSIKYNGRVQERIFYELLRSIGFRKEV